MSSLAGRPLCPQLRGNVLTKPVTGCVGQQGGYNVKQVTDSALDELRSTHSGHMGVQRGSNCGTVNPSNMGASSQQSGGGGNCGCSNETARYGFSGGNDLGVLGGSYAPVTSTTTCIKAPSSGGGKKKRRSKTRKRTGKKSRSKTRRHGKRKRKQKRRTKHKRRKSCQCKHRCRCRRRRTRQRGGYSQLGTNVPFSTRYSVGTVTPANSAMANPMKYNREMITGDNYNHFTGKNSPSPILDQAV